MQVTLGGDRLGTGKKQKVDLHSYNRSTHDLSYIWRSTMASGTLVPFMTELGLPGDTFDIDLDADIKTHPTVGPLFGSFKVQLDVFMAPVRLYQGKLHNNQLGIGMNMSKVLLPQIQLEALGKALVSDQSTPDNDQINPSCLLSYLNMRGVGTNAGPGQLIRRKFNAIPYLAYWEIYKNYYANKQEEIGAFIHADVTQLNKTVTEVNIVDSGNPTAVPEQPGLSNIPLKRSSIISIDFQGSIPEPKTIVINTNRGEFPLDEVSSNVKTVTNETGGYILAQEPWSINMASTMVLNWRYLTPEETQNKEPKIATFPLNHIDQMRNGILSMAGSADALLLTQHDLAPYGDILDGANGFYTKMSSQEGLAIKTYQSDLFNNWLNSEWIDGSGGINEITAINTEDGSFTIDTLNLSQKVYEMLNRIAVTGGSYDDWLDAVYTHERYRRCESPMYMGGLSKELVFQEVVSNAEAVSEAGEQPLGTLAGKGVMSGKNKGGKITIKVDEPCYIMGIISLTPRVDYSQGNKWDVNLKTMDDFHKPALDEIGFQDLITDQMAWWDTQVGNDGSVVFHSAGKQPAWINYMTNVNQTRGNFAIAENEMFMTLNRRYEQDKATGRIKDLTTYIDPTKCNHIFAQTSRDAQNFWSQISVGIHARRKMSAKVMPNL